MNFQSFKTIVLPITTIFFIFILWKSPLNIDYFETIIATLIVLLVSLIEYKKNFIKSLGFNAKNFTAKKTLIKAPIIAFVLFLVYYYILIPSVTFFTKAPIDFSDFDTIKNDYTLLFISIIFIWISAAFGEEIVWRGYFMKQFSKLFGKTNIALLINILLFGVLFGYLHSYQGITGQIITGILGIVLSIIFHFNKNDLWTNVAIHGFFDSFALIALYLDFL